MDQNGKRNKGTPVTRPINLKPRNVDLSSRHSDSSQSDEAKPGESSTPASHEEPKGLAGVSMMPVSRRKQAPGPEIIDQIGHRLASVYNSVLAQPIPDRFLDLLAQLEAGESQNELAEEAVKEENR
jgi:Anti-sigma factor NepR